MTQTTRDGVHHIGVHQVIRRQDPVVEAVRRGAVDGAVHAETQEEMFVKARDLLRRIIPEEHINGAEIDVKPGSNGGVTGRARLVTEGLEINATVAIRKTSEDQREAELRAKVGEVAYEDLPSAFRYVIVLAHIRAKSDRQMVRELLSKITPSEYHGLAEVQVASGLKDGAGGSREKDVAAGSVQIDAGDVQIEIGVILRTEPNLAGA